MMLDTTYAQQAVSALSEHDPIKFWINTPMGYYIGNDTFGLPFEWIIGKHMEHKPVLIAMILDKLSKDLGDNIYDVINNVSLTASNSDTIKLEISYNNRKTYKLFQGEN